MFSDRIIKQTARKKQAVYTLNENAIYYFVSGFASAGASVGISGACCVG